MITTEDFLETADAVISRGECVDGECIRCQFQRMIISLPIPDLFMLRSIIQGSCSDPVEFAIAVGNLMTVGSIIVEKKQLESLMEKE